MVLVVSLSLFRSAHADFHLMKIAEVMAQAGGDPRIQFIELQMTATFQTVVGGHKLLFFDGSGNKTGEFNIPGNVSNGTLQNGELPFILFGTQAFADRSPAAPDFIIPEGLLHPYSGRVQIFEDFNKIDSLAYGSFTGSNTGFGTPAPAFPVNGVESLTRVNSGFPKDNSKDYAFRPPSPRNNAGQTGALSNISLHCYLSDNFAGVANWDQPEKNAGLDLTDCGTPIDADIGFVEAKNNRLVFTPGLADMLGLGNPIAFTGMSNAASRKVIDQDPSQNYRVQFNMLAHLGMVDGAFFVRHHYEFNDVKKTINPDPNAGLGFNFGFDNLGETTDHIHADVRLGCLGEGAVEGEDEADFNPYFILVTETEYTVIMDVDGSDEIGPLTLQVKFYPAGQPEPIDYMATFMMGTGLGADPNEDFDHGVLIAALGTATSMEISDFSICAIPRNQQHVRGLVCSRQPDGSIDVGWSNPSQAEDKPIDLLVNGTKIASLQADTTNQVISDPPGGDIIISVVNYSGIAASCLICENDPPVAKVEGPTEVILAPNLKVTLDSTGSSDPENGALERIWEGVRWPAGSNPAIDDLFAPIINVSLDMEGSYTIRLTVSDQGCNGDPNPLSDVVEHTVTVIKPGGGNKFIRGDSNCSGEADISDAVHMLTFSFLGGEAPCCTEAADVNDDDNIADTTDAVVLLSHLFLGDPAPPAPFPGCGEVAGIECPGHLVCNR